MRLRIMTASLLRRPDKIWFERGDLKICVSLLSRSQNRAAALEAVSILCPNEFGGVFMWFLILICMQISYLSHRESYLTSRVQEQNPDTISA